MVTTTSGCKARIMDTVCVIRHNSLGKWGTTSSIPISVSSSMGKRLCSP